MLSLNLSANNISCRLGSRLVLNNISFSAEPGQLTGIIGTNGAGKSTLLSILAGIQAKFDGNVNIGGERLQSFTLNDRARRVAYLPQNPKVHWDLNAQQVTELGRLPYRRWFNWLRQPDPVDEQAVATALVSTQCDGIAQRKVQSLSNGERMRIHLARVLAVQAPIILVDEPTSGLDPYQQIHCLELLRSQAQKGCTVLAALHDLDLAARFCDRLLLLHSDKILAFGAPAEVLTPANLMTAYRIAPPTQSNPRDLNLASWERQVD